MNSSVRLLALCAAVLLAAALAAEVALARGAVPQPTTGVVDVETNLGYEGGAAAGTGIVLTSSGEVLTNNHVIRGATTIRVVVPQTGRTYRAQVLGYDLAEDVAVLKLQAASGLKTVSRGNSSRLLVGQAVTAVGNAGGTGKLVAAAGRITGLRKTITASDGEGTSEQLTGLIETDAGLEPGDSGGPLLDAGRRVVGMDTAASASFQLQTAASDAYAIPINRALSIAKQIAAGRASATVHVGASAFLGVQLQAAGDFSSPGAVIAAVVPGTPADQSGLAPGDVITALDGQPVSSPQTIAALLVRKAPGDKLQITWTDQTGNEHTATATLASGPPQ